jgi:hypothetical protein
VAAVRLGLRAAFWRASWPVIPFRAGSGAPMSCTVGRANTGPNSTAAVKMSNTPRPTASMPPSPATPLRSETAPSTVAAMAMASRIRTRVVRSIATSRIAAIGNTRAARTRAPPPTSR